MKKQLFVLLLITSMCSQMAIAQNYALTFDGTNDHVTLPATLWHNNFSDGTAITVEYWYKKGDGSTAYNMNSVYRVQTGGYFVAGYYNGKHIISTDGSTNGVSEGDQSTILNGSWHHLAVTWSKNGYFTSYLDGVQVEQRAAANVNLPVMDGINSLASFNGVSEFLNGSLDEVRIWNDVRTAQEIADNKDHELTGSETGLVAYYKMSNGSGTGLSDNTTSATYSGTLVNGPSWTDGAPVTAAGSEGNYALYFNASSGTVTIPSSQAFNFGTGDFTVEWWQYQTDNSSWTRIFYSDGLAVSIEGGTFYGWIAGSPNTSGAAGTFKNVWTHFAFTRASGATTVYKNGQVLCTGTNSSNVNNSSSALYLGSMNGFGSTFYGGSLDEFRIWNVCRSQVQIESSMNNSLTGSESGLVAYYKMSNGSGTTLSDNTSNAHTGTLNGGVTWTSGHAYLPGIATSGTLSAFSSCSGTVSSEQSFSAYGSGLSANITVTAPSGFELSTTSGGSFSSTLTLIQTGGTVNSTTIYVRMSNSASGTPSGNITLASTGATTQNVAASGSVGTTPVVSAGSDQTVSTASATLAGSISGSANTGTWSGGAGTYSPNNTTLTANYTPTAAERLAGTLTLTLTSADPAGPCGSATDQVTLTFPMAAPGNAIALDGVNDFVNAGNNASLQISTGTIEAWIKTSDAGSGYRAIVVKQWAYGLFLVDNVLAVFEWYNVSGGAVYSTGINLADNRWHHVVFSFNSGVNNGSFIYIDGVLKNTFTYSSANQVGIQNVGLGIGQGSIASTEQNFNGCIDEVRVWNTVRTQSQLQSAMYSELAGTETGLVAYYDCNQGVAGGNNTGITTLTDKTSIGNTGTLTNIARTGSSSNFVESYAMAVPVPATATNFSATGFTANWTAPEVGTVTAYKLDVSTTSGFSSFVTGYHALDCGTNLSQSVSGLATGTTYYYRVAADKTSVTGTGGYFRTPVSATTLSFIWTGNVSTDWNTTGNWSSATVPTADNDVSIPSGTPNDAHVTSAISSPAVCHNLSIESGSKLTIDAGKALTVNGTLTNNADVSDLVINNGGSLIESSGAMASFTHAIGAGEWHLISPPTSNATSGIFYGHYLQIHSEESNTYSDLTDPGLELPPMKGYALWGDLEPAEVTYCGLLNAGEMSYTITFSGSGKGWNLVGNPYPSSIDWDAASGWTKTNVDAATYCHVDKNRWATWVPGNPGVGTNGGTRYIAPCQGFFVQSTAAGTLAMTNAVRVHNNTAFFKNTETVPSLIRLQVSGNGYQDESVIRFVQEATAGFDGNYDAYKLFGEEPEAAQLYSMGESQLSINSLPETTMVPVGVKIGVSGLYTISATEINDMPFATLEDTKTGIFTELARNSYTFSFTPGEDELRFKLHLSTLSTGETESFSARIYSYRNMVYVGLNDQVKGDIFIYNMAGQLITSRLSATALQNILLSTAGVYLVKVVSESGIQTQKIIINH